jgi:anaerobic magnesium-protoporphyrin IX monomethyl ester cyclase
MKKKNELRYMLINTPLSDPTCPYHSIPYLIGSAEHKGYTNYYCLDSNIESLNYMANEESVCSLLKYCEKIRTTLDKKERLTRGEQILYRCTIQAIGLKSTSIRRAIDVLDLKSLSITTLEKVLYRA